MFRLTSVAIVTLALAAPLAAQDTTDPVDDTVDTVQDNVNDGIDAVQDTLDDAMAPEVTVEGQAGVAPGFTVTAPEGFVALDSWAGITAETVTGADLRDPTDAGVGSVTDLELGADGEVTAVIADIGGFLGMGTHTVRLGLDQVAIYQHADGSVIVYTNLTEEALRALPEHMAG